MPGAPANEPGVVRSVRRVQMHVIVETAQHADILRETLDGQKSTGGRCVRRRVGGLPGLELRRSWGQDGLARLAGSACGLTN
jgi:Protein of unknown function (DUF664)